MLAIVGSRTITKKVLVSRTVRVGLDALGVKPGDITLIISGGARGVDTIAKQIADESGIPFKLYPANWSKYGRYRAGRIRNSEMADDADIVVAVWDGVSTGTHHMIKESMNRGNLTYWNDNIEPVILDS